MSDQEDNVRQFIAVTGATEDRARFFLDSSAGKIEVALARYYETGDDENADDSDVEVVPDPKPDTATPKAPPRPKPTNFHTLNNLTVSSDEEEEEGQAYYAGGSETSGQQVLGPPKGKKVVMDMFKSIQKHGVEILEPGAGASGSKVFKGTGYKLGQENDDTVVIPGAAEPPPPRQVTLRMWQNGFSINDGELRPFDDPANREFLNSIALGETPQELRDGKGEIELAIQVHTDEPYRRMEKRGTKVFHGQGYTLGSPTPAVVGATSDEDKPANEAKAKEALKVNASEPVTNLQIRLADGTRLVGQFNHEHTVANVREYITVARPQYEAQPFNLLSTYPSKVLDDSQTLKEAGLLNAAIMQKLI